MGYKCGCCNVDFPTRKGLNEHMVDVHNSVYLEGAQIDIDQTKEHAQKKGKADLVKLSEGV